MHNWSGLQCYCMSKSCRGSTYACPEAPAPCAAGSSSAALSEGLCLCAIFFPCGGNHDLWRRPGPEQAAYPDSVCKLLALQELCDELRVHVVPAQVARGLWVVPLLSWHSCTFDEADPRCVAWRGVTCNVVCRPCPLAQALRSVK